MSIRPLALALVLAAVPLAGCGTGGGASGPGAAPAAMSAAQLPARPAPVLSERKLVRRAERFCRSSGTHLARIPDSYSRRAIVSLRRTYRRFQALGIPRGGLARRRWIGLLSQLQAAI